MPSGARDSDRADVLRLRALRTLNDVELDPLVLVQGAITIGDDGGEVDEDVLSAVDGNEAKALVSVEPLDGSLRHVPDFPSRRRWCSARTSRAQSRHGGDPACRFPRTTSSCTRITGVPATLHAHSDARLVETTNDRRGRYHAWAACDHGPCLP